MSFFVFTLGDLAVLILLGVAMLCLNMATMSRLDALEGKVDLLVELVVGRGSGRRDNSPAPAAKGDGGDVDSRRSR